MALEDLPSQAWMNLPPPQWGSGLLDTPTNRYQQIMSQMPMAETPTASSMASQTGGFLPALYSLPEKTRNAVIKLNSSLSGQGGGAGGNSAISAQQAAMQAAFAQMTPGEQAAINAMTVPNLVNLLMPLPLQILMNVMGIDAPGVTSSGGVSSTSGSPMSGIASKGTVGQVANATTTVGQAIGNAIGAGVGGIGTSPGTTGGGLAGMGSGAHGVAATAAATGSGMGGLGGGGVGGGGVGSGGVGNGSGASSAGGSSAGSAYSDIRMKEDIRPIGNAINKVRKLDGVTFDMDGKRGTGLVAQQVEDVLPEVVHRDANGMRMVDYGNIVGLLVEAIKEMDGKKGKKTKGLLEA